MNDLVVGLHKELRQFNVVSIKNRFRSMLAGFFTDIARLQRPINKTISISHCTNKNGSAKIKPAYISMNQQKNQQQQQQTPQNGILLQHIFDRFFYSHYALKNALTHAHTENERDEV